MLCSAAIVMCLGRESGIRTLVLATILRLIFSMGPEPTLYLLGFLTASGIFFNLIFVKIVIVVIQNNQKILIFSGCF